MLGTSLFAILVPAHASAQVICDTGAGTEIGFEETVQGTSDTLAGIYDLRATDFGGTIFAGTLVVDGGGTSPLDITTRGGLVQLEFGDIEIASGACVVADRLVIDRATVTVGAGALLGGNTGFLATSKFPDGGVGGTDVIGSTVNFTPGSEVLFGSPWNLMGTSTLHLDLDNDGNSDGAVFSRLSGSPFSTLEVAAGTTMNISRFAGDAGSFEGTLAGDGTINLSFGFGGTATWTARPSESTFTGTILVDNYMTLVADALGPASLQIGPRGRAFVSGDLGSLAASDFIGATDPSEDISTLGARLGINEDGSPGTLNVTGDVTLTPLTVLTMNLGAPGAGPGVGSDLINVGGNLTLDGVLLVNDAGGFGLGLYRLFNYGGTLTDGSLEVVGVPVGFSILDFNVSTATIGQVNLLVGDQGGGGEPPEIAMFPAETNTWGPGDFDPGTTVILAGAGREIAIDGMIERGPGGIQFADDDFELNPAEPGGSFFLPGTDIEINVGDGTVAGAEYIGTIGADVTGLGGITKTGLGTLVLTGNNSLAGGITMIEGTLQGTTASLTGVIDFGSIDIEQRILSTTVIFTGGSDAPLNVTALGGNYQLVGGVFEVPLDVPFVPDRLVISDSTVTVGSGATFGTGVSPFVPGTIFADGGLAGTELVNSTVIFNEGSQIELLSTVELQGASTLIFNNGPAAGPVVRSLSGGPDSTLEVGGGTTLTVLNQRNSGTFEGTLNGDEDSTIVKSGAGELTLRPQFDSTYTGTVHVQGGTLNYEKIADPDFQQINLVATLLLDENTFAYVFGDLRSLESEGTLGVCGDRAANGEGPAGACRSSTGPVTLTGDMTLGPASHLQVTLGESTAGTIINVGGDLTIDGSFDFRVGSSHSCSSGLYRIISYDGSLTDNGAEIGERPECFSGTDLSLQTSTSGQVNLLAGSTGGGGGPPEIAFFPEDTDTWQPDDFDPATTVILQGNGREISLPGEISLGTGGIQFADDGFSLIPGGVGGRILLFDDPFGFGADTPIRVGDGTAAGAAITGTIAADIIGAGGLLKTDLGTLSITGNNTYSGGTTIQAGTVEGTTESLQGDIKVLSGATVAFAGDTGTVNAALSGNGEVTFDYTERVTLATDLVASGVSVGIRVGDLLIVPGADPGTVRFDKVTIDSPASLTLGQGATVEVTTLTGAPGSLVSFEHGSVLVVDGDSILDEIAGEDNTLRVGAALTLAGNSPDYTGTLEVLQMATVKLVGDGGFGGRITGAGDVVKDGEGTLELLGLGFDSAFSGGVTVAAGNLLGGSDSLNGDIMIASGARVTLIHEGEGVLTGRFSGAGNIAVGGTGTLALGGAISPDFTGELEFAAVTIRVGDFDLPVVRGTFFQLDESSLLFNLVTSGNFLSLLGGNGDLGKTGPGELTLETTSLTTDSLDFNILEGGVRIEAGETGNTAGFGTVTIAGGAGFTVGPDVTVGVETLTGAGGSKVTLADGSVLELDGDCSHAGEIAGTGTLAIGCDLTLAADSPDFAGNIDVGSGASLTLNGTIGGELSEDQQFDIRRRLRFADDSSLDGAGIWVGIILLDPGSTISPGNSIGTFSMGAITFAPGSIFEVEVDDAGNSDLLAVNGVATLNGGIVNVLAENRTDDGSSYGIQTQYTILTAGGGVTGTFDEVTENFAFLAAALSYSANAVTLTLTRDGLADFCLGGATANQCATGEGVESLESGALFNAVLVLSEADAIAAFDGLSGEVHAALRTTLLEDSRFPREAAVARLRAAFDAVGGATDMPERRVSDGFSLWGQGFGAWGDWDGDGNAARLDRSAGGFTMGGEALIGDALRLGLFGGYTHASFDIDQRASSGSADGFHLGAYGGGQWGGFGLRAGAAYARHDVKTSRSVAFSGFSDVLAADFDARTLQAFAEAGYRLDLGAAAVEPFASLAHVSVRTEGFSETGGAAALSAAEQTVDATFTTLGMRAQGGFGGSNVRLTGMADWRHAFGGAPSAALAFAGGDAFVVAGAPLADNSAVFEAGLDMNLAPGATIGLGYAGQFGSGFSDHGANAHLAIRF